MFEPLKSTRSVCCCARYKDTIVFYYHNTFQDSGHNLIHSANTIYRYKTTINLIKTREIEQFVDKSNV